MSPTTTAPNRSAIIASLLPMITVAAVLAYATAAYFLLFKQKVGQVLPGGSLDVSAVEARLADDAIYLKKLEEGKGAFEKLNAERRAKVAGIIPVGPDIQGIMVQTDLIAARNGFVLTSFAAVPDEKEVTSTGRRMVRVSANFAGGDYAQFKVLLADLENALRVSDPVSIVFGAGASSFGFTFNVYYVDPPGTKPPVTRK